MSKNQPKTFIHPFELAFCGYSGSGKTTLIAKLLDHFAASRAIGYVKHDAHKFEMDKAGKDTHTAAQHGATAVFITDKRHFAAITHRLPTLFDWRQTMLDCDWVFIEGFKQQPAPKIIVLDEAETIVPDVASGKFVNVRAWAGPRATWTPPDGTPYFHRDDVAGIAAFLEAEFAARAVAAPLLGLLLVGGQSTRMGRDKWALEYHGRSQLAHAAALLAEVTDGVFISARPGQTLPDTGHPVFVDRIEGRGPLGGIATAQLEKPAAAWLVIAVDLPHLTRDALRQLIEARDPYKIATAYTGEEGLPEPLCAIYEPKSAARLLQGVGFGLSCPRKVLLNAAIKLVAPADAQVVANANTPADYEAARAPRKEEPHA